MPVFSVTDFKEGLDVRKTPLTAPGGSLRILENAVLNQGGEIEKRQAFVPVAHIPVPPYDFLFGHRDGLNLFSLNTTTPAIDPGTCPVPIQTHGLASVGETIVEIVDVEAFNEKFFVSGIGASGTSYVWFDGVPVTEVDGSKSHGTYSRLWNSKMYRIDGQYLRFSGTNNPAMNDPANVTYPGAGFINIGLNDPDGEELMGMEIYYDSMALQARLLSQIWSLDPDPNNDSLKQLLRIGTNSPYTIVQFGTGDVLFLSDSGVRSLKAMTINLAASVSDVGSAIDLMLMPIMRANPIPTRKARATIQPIQGRYWVHLNGRIYVLSYFPAGNITAWSTFDHGFNLRHFAVVENRVFAFGADGTIYAYGGPSLTEFDSCKMVVRTPHMSANNPTQKKRIQSVDVMCQGPWSLSIGMNASNTELFELVANITDNTYDMFSIPYAGYGTHFAAHLEHQAPGPATLAAIHFNYQEGVVK